MIWANILAVLTAIPQIIKLLDKFGEWIKAGKLEALAKAIEETSNKIEVAKTKEEYQDAAKSVANTIRKLNI